jgi:hypothetical protein
MKVATRWRALVMAGGLVALPVRSRAQEAPPDTLTDYVFLALKRLDVLGPVRLDSGSVGVNETGKGQDHRITVDQPLLLDPVTGVIAADRTDLNQPSTCATVFANSGTGDCVGAGGVQPLEVTQLVADPLAACGYPDNFPACGKEDMTIGEDETLTLPEGTYGDVTVSSGTLILSGGEYVFCSLTVEDSTVRAEKPSIVLGERQIDIRGASILNPDLPTSDFRVLSETTHVDIIIMGSQTLLRGSVCSVFRGGQATMPQVRALLCAPKAKLDVKNARVEGTFLAMDIDIAMVTGGNVPPPPTTTTTSTTSTTTSTTSSTTSSSSTTTTSTTSTTGTTGATTSTTTTPSTTTSSTTTTSTSSSTSTTGTSPTSTSTSTPVSTSTTSTVPECNTLRVTESRLVRSRDNPAEGSLMVRAVLAPAGWEGVNPQATGVAFSGNRRDGAPLFCCSTDGANWRRRGRRSFVLALPRARGLGCPLERVHLTIGRNGTARITAVVRRVDLSSGAERSVTSGTSATVTVVAGDRCGEGQVFIPPAVEPTPRPPRPPAHECGN